MMDDVTLTEIQAAFGTLVDRGDADLYGVDQAGHVTYRLTEQGEARVAAMWNARLRSDPPDHHDQSG